MPLIQITTGEENVAQAGAKVYVFHSPTDQQSREKVLPAIVKEVGGEAIARKVGSSTFIGAVIGIRPEIGGQWVTTSYEITEGEIIKIFAAKKTGWKKLLTKACQFLRMRHDAPLHKVKIKLLNSPRTKLKTADIIGRFDLLTLAEAKTLGVTVAPAYEGFFADIVTKAMFEVEVLEKSTSPQETVRTRILPAVGAEPAMVIRRRRLRRSLELKG